MLILKKPKYLFPNSQLKQYAENLSLYLYCAYACVCVCMYMCRPKSRGKLPRDPRVLGPPPLLGPAERLALDDAPDEVHGERGAPGDGLFRGVGGDVQEDDLAGAAARPEVRQAAVVDEVAEVPPGILGYAQVEVFLNTARNVR